MVQAFFDEQADDAVRVEDEVGALRGDVADHAVVSRLIWLGFGMAVRGARE